ncbi:hypothetical protein UFOVP27_113 [uncultured Caudovirales phage]|uniref:Uncharacterized protein n=1 Tax=uncultured Caudovirales phage TaxID=2100421 RepID=A0A6J5KM29_9CAUD|nr:hypothetical protein UFOVP27_113 [uncultured Caudovirales phage]
MAKAKVTDVTGRQREEQLKTVAEQQAARANEISMATRIQEVKDETEVTDLTINPAAPTIIDDVESVGVSLADDSVVVRVAETLEMMTFGAGNYYSFEAGKKYKVSKALAYHLEEKGYLSNRL